MIYGIINWIILGMFICGICGIFGNADLYNLCEILVFIGGVLIITNNNNTNTTTTGTEQYVELDIN